MVERKKSEAEKPETGSEPAAMPEPEVSERPRRRRYSAEYKQRILSLSDELLKEPGALGPMLRREGLYSSHLVTWRKQREQGALDALTPKKRGRKPKDVNPLGERLRELERENRKLQGRLKQAETIIEIQKKVSEILGVTLPEPPSEESE